MSQYILAIDQGTTSSRCLLFDRKANMLAVTQQEFQQIFPQPGWVEHDAETIWQSQFLVIQQLLSEQSISANDIAGIGITNQRETTIIWDRETGLPIHNAIVWQDRRTAGFCEQLKSKGLESLISNKTGLLLDAYFSATKIHWLLEHVAEARKKAEQGKLAFGTVDSWLTWNLTAGNLHITDVSNASRSMLYNINSLQWDDELLELFAIPKSLLPEVKPSSENYGVCQIDTLNHVPICALVGDQQAALFGQQCIEPGMAKCTYGTGSFLMLNTGNKPTASQNQLLTTIAWQIDEQVHYALEGSIFTSGSLIQWLRDGLGFFSQAPESEALAASVEDNGGVIVVPALAGLGAPHWDASARGCIFGLTRGVNKAHITRAALESICLQVDELLTTMQQDTDITLAELKVDGGAVANNLLMQLQADISAIKVIRPDNLETTALGAAYLAGIAIGFWNPQDLLANWSAEKHFTPRFTPEHMLELKAQWQQAIKRSKNWQS